MNCNQLSKEQLAQIHADVYASLGYLRRLLKRIEDTQFPADDPLRLAVAKAQVGMFELDSKLQFLVIEAEFRETKKRR